MTDRCEGGRRVRGEPAPHDEEFPIVTVVTVVKNGAECLERTIHSVLQQTYRNVEYIVVDGASTDGTIDVIRRYDADICYWVSEADEGIYSAMNKGIDLARGGWICFINSGDEMLPVLHRLRDALLMDAPIIYGNTKLVHKNGNITESTGRIRRKEHLITGWEVWHQSILYNRKYIGHYDTRYKLVADTILTYEAVVRAEPRRPVYVDEFISMFWYGQGQSATRRKEALAEERKYLMSVLQKIPIVVLGRFMGVRATDHVRKWGRLWKYYVDRLRRTLQSERRRR